MLNLIMACVFGFAGAVLAWLWIEARQEFWR